MDIIVLGLNHKTAPVHIRERVAFPEKSIHEPLRALHGVPGVRETMILSTCNRVEIAAVVESRDQGAAAVRAFVAGHHEVVESELVPHLYLHAGADAVRHLFRVASSLDSLVVGEPQILGQLKDAFACARAAHTVGPWLNRAFEHAFRVAKRVRSETALGAGQVSIPTVAVDLAREIFSELAGHRVLLVGTGEMANLVATLLGRAGAQVLVVGRTLERTREVAQKLGAEPRAWDDFPALIGNVDIVVSSTSAPGFIITIDHLVQARRQRHGRNLFLVDLAVP